MMVCIIDNWPMIVAVLAVVAALWLARRGGIERGILIGRAQVIREVYRKREGRL